MDVEPGDWERVNLREAWPTEDRDFTHWLAKPANLAWLGKAIGLELRLVGVEQRVGSFRADILCSNVADGSTVIIENQLDGTDHSHLGQLLTYAAGHQADTIVWIADHFRGEHGEALDYLNRRTDEKANFFGVTVELWKLGGTVSATFNVVSGPGGSAAPDGGPRRPTEEAPRRRSQPARRAESAREGGLTPAARLRLEYWTALMKVIETDPGPLRTAKPSSQSWHRFAMGRSDFVLVALAYHGKPYVLVELEVWGPRRSAHFHALEARKSQIEADLGFALEWNELPNNQICRIILKKDGMDVENRADWPRQHAWLLKTLKAFHRAFADRIQALGG